MKWRKESGKRTGTRRGGREAGKIEESSEEKGSKRVWKSRGNRGGEVRREEEVEEMVMGRMREGEIENRDSGIAGGRRNRERESYERGMNSERGEGGGELGQIFRRSMEGGYRESTEEGEEMGEKGTEEKKIWKSKGEQANRRRYRKRQEAKGKRN